MARNKGVEQNIDNSDLAKYPNGRIADNDGSGNGTPINERTSGDIHEFFAKLMRLAGLTYNNLPDNESLGYQLVDALKAFANKNNFVETLGSSNGKLTIPLRITTLQTNESLVCLATSSFSNETVIRSTIDNTEKAIQVIGDFKSGEYVRLINTNAVVFLVREVNAVNQNLVNNELGFLKAATPANVIAGILDNVSVTPESFLVAFAEYVVGNTSANFLASIQRNGLYPKEHFDIVEGLESNVINTGKISRVDPLGSSGALNFVGDVASAIATIGDGSQIQVNMSNTMGDNNYFVRLHVESKGNVGADNNYMGLSFRVNSPTQFIINIDEVRGGLQILDIHFEAVKI